MTSDASAQVVRTLESAVELDSHVVESVIRIRHFAQLPNKHVGNVAQ